MKIPASVALKPEAVRVASILEGLDKSSPGAEVFEAFEALDELPADVVRAVLSSVTGPAPDPEQLDAATRRAHGFPAPPLVLRCTSALAPSNVEELNRIEQDQLRLAGRTWDGHDLPAAARLAKDGGEASFAGALELKRFIGADGSPVFDVVLYGEGSGAIFAAGTSDVVGAVAYGVVELKDKRARVGLQPVLGSQPDPAAEARAREEHAKARAEADARADARAKADAKAEADARARAEARSAAQAQADGKAKAAADALAAAAGEAFPVVEPATERRAKKIAAPKKLAAADVEGELPAKKTAAKAEPRKAAAKKAEPKKTTAKKTTAKKATAKKATAKKATAKKTTAKKATAKKTAASKKTAAKKTAVAPKRTAGKKTR